MSNEITKALDIAFYRGLEEYDQDPSNRGNSRELWGYSRMATLAKRSDGSKDTDLFSVIPPPAPPLLSVPLPSSTLTKILLHLNKRMRKAGLQPIKRHECSLVDAAREKDPRIFAHTNHRKKTICYSKEILRLPLKHIWGIFAHEAGHEAAFEAWGNYEEEAADVAAFEMLDFVIQYQGESLLQVIVPNHP